jgi:uncharacterized RmlC-like cupin family protein
MSSSAAIHIVSPAEFDRATAPTPGSERRAAIAPALGIASTIWGGLFEVEPGSRTGIHHHGEQETIAYVLSGICEIRRGERGETVARAKAGDLFMSPLSCRIWKSILQTRSRFDGLSYEAHCNAHCHQSS